MSNGGVCRTAPATPGLLIRRVALHMESPHCANQYCNLTSSPHLLLTSGSSQCQTSSICGKDAKISTDLTDWIYDSAASSVT